MSPNFLYIGTGKAGSTWLFEALQQHPQVFVTPVKETNFFDLNFHRGMAWYQDFFRPAQGRTAVGEIGHRYLRHPEAAQRIREALGPDVRLLAFFRRPESFALSAYQFACRNGRFRGSAGDWMQQRFNPESVSYYSLLQPYIGRFDRSQIFIGCFDELEADPQAFYASVCRFLGVDTVALPVGLKRRVNGAARARLALLARLVNLASKFLKSRGHPRLIAWVKRQPLLNRLLYAELSRKSLPALPADARARIRSIAEPELALLDRAMGTQLLSRWYPDADTATRPATARATVPA